MDLFESLQAMTENNIDLKDNSLTNFTKTLNSILSWDNKVSKLELFSSLGGDSDRYWYKAVIDIDPNLIKKVINQEKLPESSKLLQNNNLEISNDNTIVIDCSAFAKDYKPTIKLGIKNKSGVDMSVLDKEATTIGEVLIDKLFSNESKLIKTLKESENLNEDLILIEEEINEDEFKNNLKAKAKQIADIVNVVSKYTNEYEVSEILTDLSSEFDMDQYYPGEPYPSDINGYLSSGIDEMFLDNDGDKEEFEWVDESLTEMIEKLKITVNNLISRLETEIFDLKSVI